MNKRKIFVPLVAVGLALGAAGCTSPADNASNNISKAAENFKVVRQVTVLNGITDKVLFQAVGAFSFEHTGNVYDFTFKMEDGTFKRHTVFASDNSPVVIEDLSGVENADAWIYKVFYLPGTPVTVQLEK